MSQSKRSFTIVGSDIGFTGGVYHSTSTPNVAAKRAASMIFRIIRHGAAYVKNPSQNAKYAKFAKFARFEKVKSIKFLIRETTRGSSKDSSYYEAFQKALDKPVTIVRNGVEITLEHKIDVKVCKDPHDHHRS